MMQALTLPDGVPKGIAAWRLPLALDATPSDADWRLLSGDERDRAGRFRRPADRVRAVATRAALRRELGALLGRDPGGLHIVAGAHGKPALAGGELTFSVSHSGAEAAIAISSDRSVTAIGIDVQQCEASADIASLAQLALTASERQAMAGDPSGARRFFFTHWVGKEAVLKAVGLGVPDMLQRVDLDALGTSWLRVRQDVATATLNACLLPAPEGYAAALAWQDKER